jgi:hypothetical protein
MIADHVDLANALFAEGITATEEQIRSVVLRLKTTHDWQCGCGHWNGANLAVCALCGRTPNES